MTNPTPRIARVHRPRSIDEQARSVRTRRTVLAAAADLINSGRTVRIDDLTASSGVTRGEVHSHFESKTDLVRVLIDDAADQVHRAYSHGAEAVQGQSAMTIVEDFVNQLAANPVLHATCVLWTDHEVAGRARAATREPLRRALVNALAASAELRRDPAITADLLLAVITAHTATGGEGVRTVHIRAAVSALIAEILR